MNLRVPCLILLLFAAGAHAQMPPPEAPAMSAEEAARLQAAQQAARAWHARMAVELAASGKARELALAATLLQLAARNPAPDAGIEGDAPSQPTPRDPRVDQWRRLASARAGSDVIANALLTGADSGAPGDAAIRGEAIERWRRLEPDNLQPLLYGDANIGPRLAQARTTKRFDGHLYDQVRWIQSALLAHPPTEAERSAMTFDGDFSPDESAAMRAMGIVLAVAAPPLQPLMEACRGEALSSTPTRADDCRHVARVMADASDAGLGTSVGIRLLEQLATNDAERAQTQARRRRMDWQMLEWGRLSAAQPRDGAAQFVRLLHDPAVHSEQDLLERVLEEGGVALDPPAGWQPPRR